MTASFFELAVISIAALLPIINPFSTAPLFLAITEGQDETTRNQDAKMGVIYMISILSVFLVAGSLIMAFFGISLPGVRIAGGVLIGRIAFRMLYPPDDAGLTRAEEQETKKKQSVAFFPLAMPSLSGPGSIAVTISLATLAENWWDYLGIFSGILVIGAIVFMTLRMATMMTRFLGVNGVHALTKIMGFLMFCIAVQFILAGLTDPDLLERIRQGWFSNLD